MELLDERDVVVVGCLGQVEHRQVVRLEPRAEVVRVAAGGEETPIADDLREPVPEDRRDEALLGTEVVVHR
jgi:hypothetical protein